MVDASSKRHTQNKQGLLFPGQCNDGWSISDLFCLPTQIIKKDKCQILVIKCCVHDFAIQLWLAVQVRKQYEKGYARDTLSHAFVLVAVAKLPGTFGLLDSHCQRHSAAWRETSRHTRVYHDAGIAPTKVCLQKRDGVAQATSDNGGALLSPLLWLPPSYYRVLGNILSNNKRPAM